MVWGWKLSKEVGKSRFDLSGIVKSDVNSFLKEWFYTKPEDYN